MKTKLPFCTRLGNLLLLLSILLQILCLGLMYFVSYRNLGQDVGASVKLGGLINIYGMESYMLFGSSIAEASLFRALFTRQARGELKKLNWLLVTLIFVFVADYSTVFSKLHPGGRLDSQEMLELVLDYIIPLLTAIAISFSSRILAILSALGRILTTLWNIGVLLLLRGVMGTETVLVMVISEFLIGLGIVIGLLGVKKPS